MLPFRGEKRSVPYSIFFFFLQFRTINDAPVARRAPQFLCWMGERDSVVIRWRDVAFGTRIVAPANGAPGIGNRMSWCTYKVEDMANSCGS